MPKNIFAQLEEKNPINQMRDRDQGGQGLDESPWLIDDKQMSEIQKLSGRWDVTPGELYRHVINQGIKHLKKRQETRQTMKLEN